MSDILVVKCNVFMRDKQMDDLYDHIKSQMEDGLVVLPPYCEAVLVPEDIAIKMTDATGIVVKEDK